jgi:hypothetical protein
VTVTDPYQTLGVEKTATREEIARAYRRLAKQHHPDAGAQPSPKMSRINEAWYVLSDRTRRAGWDVAHSVAVPPHWSAPAGDYPTPMRPIRPMRPAAAEGPRSRMDNGPLAFLVIASAVAIVGAVTLGIYSAFGTEDPRAEFVSDEISFRYEQGWTIYPGDGEVVGGQRVIAHLASYGLLPEEQCTSPGEACHVTGETMPEAQVSMLITSWNEGIPPEPEPVRSLPNGLSADGIIGGQPAAFEVVQEDDVFVVWWQLSPPGFPDRWIEVRADFRASHPIDRDRIFPAIQALLESVEFRD